MRDADGEGVRVFAPATTANLGLGFDILGLALEGAGDTVTARRSRKPGVRIVAIRGDGGRLPLETAANTAGVAAVETLRRSGTEFGVELEIDKGLPLGSGLGSSAASAVAAAVAVNALLGSPLRRSALVEPCMAAEAVVAGRHADNVAPALLGGLILVRSIEPLDLIRLPVPPELCVVVVTPELELTTRDARSVLPETVGLHELVRTTANIAALTCACFTADLALLARCMIGDAVTEARAPLIPGCKQVIAAALGAGALGSAISGAGPSLFALCRSQRSAAHVATAMREAFAAAGLASSELISAAECPGARIL